MMYSTRCSVASLLVAIVALTSVTDASEHRPHKRGGHGRRGKGRDRHDKKCDKCEGLTQLDLARVPQPVQREEFLQDDPEAFRLSFLNDGNTIDNAAVLQRQLTKGQDQFLSTLAKDGQAQFLTALKPCGILLPHVHQRANEFYSVIDGIMNSGISQENTFAQDIVFDTAPGEVFVAPQGLMHFNHNQQCEPLLFFQSFDSADPGAINVIGALAAFNDAGGNGAAAMLASGAESIEASPQGAFALDPVCLKRCGFPRSGAPGDGLKDLDRVLRVLLGLDGGDDKPEREPKREPEPPKHVPEPPKHVPEPPKHEPEPPMHEPEPKHEDGDVPAPEPEH